MTPNGHILACNGKNGQVVEVDPVAGKQIYAQWIDTNQAQSPPGNGDLFGLAMTPDGKGFYYVEDDMNTSQRRRHDGSDSAATRPARLPRGAAGLPPSPAGERRRRAAAPRDATGEKPADDSSRSGAHQAASSRRRRPTPISPRSISPPTKREDVEALLRAGPKPPPR
jgi:hypothetical protein